MTHDELRAAVLAEQYTHTPAADHGRVLAAWTEHEQARHRSELEAELLAALAAVAPSPVTHRRRWDLADDLPPTAGPTIVVRSQS